MTRPRFRSLRLKIPSLYQYNARGDRRGTVWCGRTSAAMIYNYYKAVAAGGVEAGAGDYIVNQRDRAPYDLVAPDGRIAPSGYDLIGLMRQAHPQKWREINLARSGTRGPIDETAIRTLLAPVLRALEAGNPLLFYSGLSSNATVPRHIVVISGYRLGPGGTLALHIDDPGSRYRQKKNGDPAPWKLVESITNAGALEGTLQQLEPDGDPALAGRRYWLRASHLFEPNLHSSRAGDRWCDHLDKPGFRVWINTTHPVDPGPCLELAKGEVGLPVELAKGEGLAAAWALATGASAPYPMGGNRTWHNGIHLPYDPARLASDKALCCAPGELRMVRFPARAKGARYDEGAVLIEHRLGAVPYYSLTMHLTPGPQGAEHILRRVDPGPRPQRREFVPATAPAGLLAAGPKGWTDLGVDLRAGRECPLPDALRVETGTGPRRAIPFVSASNVDKWETGRPQAPWAPRGATLGFFDAVRDKVLRSDLDVPRRTSARVAVRGEPGSPRRLDIAAEHDDGSAWVRLQLDSAKVRGGRCVHHKSERAALGEAGQGLVVARRSRVAFRATVGGRRVVGSLTLSGARPLTLRTTAAPTDRYVAVELEACTWLGPRTEANIRRRLAKGKPAPTIGGSKLRYHDPRTSAVHTSRGPIVRGAKPRIEGGKLVFVGKTRYAKIEAPPPEIRTDRHTCAHGRAELDAMLAIAEEHWPLTRAQGDKLSLTVLGRRAATDNPGPVSEATLGACALVDKDARAALQGELDANHKNKGGAALDRLRAGHTRLIGVMLRRRDGWELDGDIVRPRAAAVGKTLRLYPLIGGRGAKRYFRAARSDIARTALRVKATKDLKLACVHRFVSGRNRVLRALVEVGITTAWDQVGNNDAELKAWDRADAFAKKLRDAVATGDPVDLVALEKGVDLKSMGLERYRTVAQDVIGTIGECAPGKRGLHFEIFAGRALPPNDGSAGVWRVVRDASDGKWLARDAFPNAVRTLLDDSILDSEAKRAAPGKGLMSVAQALDEGIVRPREWMEFCGRPSVARMLSRVVAVHQSEWAVPWADAAANVPKIRSRKLSQAERAGWWPKVELAGIDAQDRLHFHHPLRFIEWRTTGLDIDVDAPKGKTLQLALEHRKQQHVLQRLEGAGPHRYALRTVVGDAAQDSDAILHLEGVGDEDQKIPIRLEAGRVHQLWLTDPRVELALRQQAPRVKLAVPCEWDDVASRHTSDDVHLLADGNAKLASAGISRARFEAEARFNRAGPDTVKVTLAGKGFAIARVQVVGAKAKVTASDKTRFTASVAIPKGRDPDAFGRVVVAVEVVHTSGIGTATLSVALTGGELKKAPTHTVKVASRVMRKKDVGEDVAKLQLYLSQIFADGEPCYRKPIDGDYGGGTVDAVERFVRAYDPKCDPVNATQVDAKRVEQIVRHYAIPHALPRLELQCDPPDLEDLPDGFDAKALSTILPEGTDVEVLVVAKPAANAPPGDARGIAIEVKLPATSALRVIDAPSDLRALLDKGVKLRPTGTLTTKRNDNKLRVVARDVTLGELRLGGTRDLRRGGSGKGVDAVLVQSWLARFGYYGGTVDGSFGGGSKKALRRLIKRERPGRTYAEVLAALRRGPRPVQEGAR